MELIFGKPIFLYLLLYIPFLLLMHFIFIRYSKRRAILFANFETLKRVSKKYKLKGHIFLLILRCFLIISLVLTLSQTKISYDGEGETANYVIAFDSSTSMLSKNQFGSRIDFAKSQTNKFIDSIGSETKVGIIKFSSNSEIINLLTTDKLELKQTILSDIYILNETGTNIGDAIYTSSNLLISQEGTKKLIILTDGQDNVGNNINKAIKYANKNNIIIYPIGIGRLKTELYDNLLKFELNEEELKNIALVTGGKYYLVENTYELGDAFSDIREVKNQKILIEINQYLLQISILILLFEYFILKTVYKITP